MEHSLLCREKLPVNYIVDFKDAEIKILDSTGA